MNTDGFINYIQLTYCTIKSEPYSVIILALFLTILFFAIGTNADDLYAFIILLDLFIYLLLLFDSLNRNASLSSFE